jgi:hypothetical protein
MNTQIVESLPQFLEIMGLDEEPMGIFYTDELSFTVPVKMFIEMINRYDESFLKTQTWTTVRKKIERSKKTWGEN